MKIKFLFVFTLALFQPLAHSQFHMEEIIIDSGRSDGAPIVLSVKGDFHFQPARILNDSLIAEERVRDVKLMYERIVQAADNNDGISLVTAGNNPIVDSSDFGDRYVDSKSNNMGYISFELKSKIADHDPKEGSYLEKYTVFLNDVNGEGAGRTKVQFIGESDISIVNPRQYRADLISAIGDDIQHLTEALGGDYRVILEGLDGELEWHREGEDNVEFYIPYQFKVIPRNFTSHPSDY